MFKKALKLISVILIISALFLGLSADSGEFKGLTRSVLDNGMELFVVENHVVPLTWIQITFRCGAITQSPETAGLFHLYEHMLFKGNKAYPDQTSFANAMKDIGVTTWNGGTSGEYVTYYFSVPSDKVEKGIEFWANAVRYPLFNKTELESEKGVVINEIKGYNSDPSQIFYSAIDKYLFYKYPWRKDVGGAPKHIQSATVETMKQIQNTYYVPNNAVLFVGGDVNPQQVKEYVNKYFGDWKKNPNLPGKQAPHPFITQNKNIVYSDETFYKNFIFTTMKFRGPDVLDDPVSTYAADIWGTLLENPDGNFVKNINKKIKGLYRKDLIVMYYFTQRDGGEITFLTYLKYSKKDSTTERLAELKKAVMDEINAMISDPNYFSEEEYDLARRKLADSRLINSETPEFMIQNLSFWWASANTDYYFNYSNNCNKVGYKDIKAYLEKYISGKNYVFAVRMNANDYENDKQAFKDSGFSEITEDNAYWWE